MSPPRCAVALVLLGWAAGCTAAAPQSAGPPPSPERGATPSPEGALPPGPREPPAQPPASDASAPARPAEAPSRDPWRANDDPSDDSVEGPPEPFAGCAAQLASAGASHRPAEQPVKIAAGKRICGVEQAISYLGGPEKIGWSQPVLSCGMGVALARFERVIAEEAQRHLGRRVRGVLHGAPYQCRAISKTSVPSEHSYANAIDIFGFSLDDGKRISVELQFGSTQRPEGATPEARFLRAVARRAFEEGIFSTVLTPYFNADHRDHLHLDLGRYRADGTR